MAICVPMLPPKGGYVEVEVDGRRTYKNVKTGELIDFEVPEEEIDVWDEMAKAYREGVQQA